MPWIGELIAGKRQISVHKPFNNTLDTLKGTFQREGIVGLYRGFSVSLIGSVPATVLYFTTYEATRRKLKEQTWLKNRPYVSDFLGGLVAEAVSCILFVPIDVIKERMQVQSNVEPKFRYRNTSHAIQAMMSKEGFRGLFRAYGATLASYGPFSGLSLMFFEQFKELYCRKSGVNQQEMSAAMIALCASSAGGIAGFITNPLDTVKVRMQVQRGGIYKFGYRHILHGLYRLLREESKRAMFAGAGARVAYIIPHAGFTITLYEVFTRWYREHLFI